MINADQAQGWSLASSKAALGHSGRVESRGHEQVHDKPDTAHMRTRQCQGVPSHVTGRWTTYWL